MPLRGDARLGNTEVGRSEACHGVPHTIESQFVDARGAHDLCEYALIHYI